MTLMYRLLVIMMCALLAAGCSSLKNSDFLNRTGDALSKIGQRGSVADLDQEIEPLFDQPYIDPLTEYLQQYADDPARTTLLGQVRQEREFRCAVIARRYNADEVTKAGLALYRRGYSFSCSQDVAAYQARLEAMQPAPKPARQPAIEPRSDDREKSSVQLAELKRKTENTEALSAGDAQTQQIAVSAKAAAFPQLNDCYLLTRIRNFSGALKACRGPAEDGVAGAQASMAKIERALGNHESAYGWALKAASDSGQAANLLGEMYAQGLGVAQDKNAAVKWFRAAAGLGHAGAENALDNLVSATAGANVI